MKITKMLIGASVSKSYNTGKCEIELTTDEGELDIDKAKELCLNIAMDELERAVAANPRKDNQPAVVTQYVNNAQPQSKSGYSPLVTDKQLLFIERLLKEIGIPYVSSNYSNMTSKSANDEIKKLKEQLTAKNAQKAKQ